MTTNEEARERKERLRNMTSAVVAARSKTGHEPGSVQVHINDLIAVLDLADAAPDHQAEAPSDDALWDFANDLIDAWNIEDTNPPSLIEDFRDRFVARFGALAARPVVDAPSDEAWPCARCGEAREAHGWGHHPAYGCPYEPIRAARPVETHFVPDDAAVERAAQVIYAATTRSYAYAPWSMADQAPFIKVADEALRAALEGGE